MRASPETGLLFPYRILWKAQSQTGMQHLRTSPTASSLSNHGLREDTM